MNPIGYHAVNRRFTSARACLFGTVRAHVVAPSLETLMRRADDRGRHGAPVDRPPLTTEAVTYVVQRTESLMGCSPP